MILSISHQYTPHPTLKSPQDCLEFENEKQVLLGNRIQTWRILCIVPLLPPFLSQFKATIYFYQIIQWNSCHKIPT